MEKQPVVHTKEQTCPPAGKRLIVCCDGTWLNADNGLKPGGLFHNGRMQIPSNVTRLCRAIECTTNDGRVPQVVYYQAGVGTGNSLWDRVIGGGTGMGLSEHIREAYSFIADNYAPGDEIFLVGFSRGAFTARSLAGLIGQIGLLTKSGLNFFYEIFKDYENSEKAEYQPLYPNVPFPQKPRLSDPQYTVELEARGLTRLNIPIKAVCVWDTVGALGIPSLGWLARAGLAPPRKQEYAFYDTRLGANVEHAFQALALDERRAPFTPAVWERPAGCMTDLRQCWFPGTHGDVGGGHEDEELANVTLAWMMGKLEGMLESDEGYIVEQWRQHREWEKGRQRKMCGWGEGGIENSLKGLMRLVGSVRRTPGRYYRANRRNGRRDTGLLLSDTCETLHASVRLRWGKKNLGVGDCGVYRPPALKGWALMRDLKIDGMGEEMDEGQGRMAWEYKGNGKSVGLLREDELSEMEKKLLAMDREAWERVMGRQLGE